MHAHHGVADASRGISYGGKTDHALIDELYVARLGRVATVAERERFVADYLVELDAQLAAGGAVALDGVHDLLDALRAHEVVVGIATGNVRAGADAKLRAVGFDPARFVVGGYGSDSHVRAELVAAAIRRAKEAGEVGEVVVIGDTVHDIAAAKANGAVAIGVSTGSDPADKLAAAGADEVWSSLREIRL